MQAVRNSFSIHFIFVKWNAAIFFFKCSDTFLRQKFQLRIQRTLVLFGDVCDFVQQFRFKSNPCLHFVCCHTHTSIAI